MHLNRPIPELYLRAIRVRGTERDARNSGANPHRFERGVALAMSILFLLLLTIIGVTSMNTSVLQERMAGNMRDQDIALQAAETSIRYGDDQARAVIKNACIQPPPSNCAAPDANGLWCPNGVQVNNPAWWSTWGIILQQDATKQVAEAQEDPRHVIEYLERVRYAFPGDTYGSDPARLNLRITARGVGSTGTSEIVLRKAFSDECD